MLVSKKALIKVLPKLNEIDDQQITKAFNNSGCEVERIIKHPKIDNLVIGKILKVENHPNADKLHVCTVALDDKGTQHVIVCGADNVEVNKFVIVALQGTQMVDGRVIQYKELRGVLSQGMLCAYNELTNNVDFLSSTESHNIITMDEATLGDTNVLKYINLDDTIYDLSLPSNRNDLNSVYSICQELSGYFDLGFTNKLDNSNITISSSIHVDKESTNGLVLLELKNISIKESNWHVKSFLMNNGIVPVNELVDKLAIISLYTNTSINCYDFDKVGKTLFINNNKDTCTAKLNNKSLNISTNDLVISNKNNILGLVGISAFDEFKPNESTKNVLVEIGNYDFKKIRKSMISLDLSIENGKRLTRPITNWSIKQALSLFANEFKDISIVYHDLNIEKEKQIEINFTDASKFIGIEISSNEITNGLSKYGYSLNSNIVIVPAYRLDIESYQDIYEEIVKIVDIDQIKGSPITTEIVLNDTNIEFNKTQEISNLLNANYFTEVKTYNLVNKKSLETFNVYKYQDSIKVGNPISSNREFMRNNLIESLLDVYEYNLSYKNSLQPIYEIQKIYIGDKTHLNLTCLTTNNLILDKVNKSHIVFNVDSLKSIINSIGNLFNVHFDYFNVTSSDIFYPDEMLTIYCCGQLLGYVGRIKQSKLHHYGLNETPVFAFTLNLNLLFDLYQPLPTKVKYESKLIPVNKDISYISDLNKNTVDIQKALNELPFVSKFEYIDVYPLEDGRFSYTIRVYFVNDKKLDSAEIDQYIKEVINILITLHCEVRR